MRASVTDYLEAINGYEEKFNTSYPVLHGDPRSLEEIKKDIKRRIKENDPLELDLDPDCYY